MMKSDLRLLHLSQGMVNTQFMLAAGCNVAGRFAEVHVFLPEMTVSRWHALIRVTETGVTIRDLESQSGTFIDDRRVQRDSIRLGQRIRFGAVELRLASGKDLAPEFGPDFGTDDPRFPVHHPKTESALPDGLTRMLHRLTNGQRKVFGPLLQGHAEKKIAANLGLAKSTVHNHLMAIFEKFGVGSKPELLSAVLRLVNYPLLVNPTAEPSRSESLFPTRP